MPARPLELRATMAGPVARAVFAGAGPRRGRVLAVFRSVVCLDFGGDVVAIARQGVEPGPLNVLTDAEADFQRLGLAAGQEAVAGAMGLSIAGALRLSLATARPWVPPVPPAPVEPDTLAQGIAALRDALPREIADLGLGGFLMPGHRPDPGDLVGQAARAPIAAARGWLTGRPGQDCRWARELVGLGPGLTPAGDDFLGGAMVALHAIGRGPLARELWAEVGPAARQETNPISFGLLQAAAGGQGGASLHEAVNALLGQGGIGPALARLGRVGHSSGWDALAGAVAVLETTIAGTGRQAA